MISGLLGRWHRKDPDSKAFILKKIKPRTRFFLIGLAVTVLFLCLAYFGHVLTNPKGVRTTIGLILNPAKPAHVSLSLLQDPVGLIAIVMTLLTPMLFAEQVSAIRLFNETNERNIAYRANRLKHEEINREVRLVNKRFRFIGRGDVSVVVLLLSGFASLVIDYLFRKWGLFPSWNETGLPDGVWRHRVYAGWWANPGPLNRYHILHPGFHLILAIALWSVGCYFFYFVIKQVTMGAFFAVYIQRISLRDFGVAPNMEANIDGFWGLRPMRRFMQATYSSALGHTIMIVGILVVWLPFNAFTVFILAVVIVINATVVIYPSFVGHVGVYREKMHFAEYVLADAQRPTATSVALVEAIWDRPGLPFRARSAATAMTVYLLLPLLLAVLSKLLRS